MPSPKEAAPYELQCIPLVMLPGYGFPPLPDFQPHLHTLHCRGQSPNMWIPGSPESQALSEARKDRPFPRQPLHHVAVCKLETLTFTELPQSPLNGLSPSPSLSPNRRSLTPSPERGGGAGLSPPVALDIERSPEQSKESGVPAPSGTDPKPADRRSEPAISVRPRPPLSLPLFLPLSSPPDSRDHPHSQRSFSLDLGVCSAEACSPQRRTSYGDIKEKSIRRKMRVYSPDSLSDDSLSSPSPECEYLFPGPFLEEGEELGLVSHTLPATRSPSPPAGVPREPQPHALPGPPLSPGGRRAGSGSAGGLVPEGLSLGSPHAGPGDQERRRFSASELISRLQLSQRKSSFALKLGKSLSARVAPRDRQGPHSHSPSNKSSSRDGSSGASSDSGPHSPTGPSPPGLLSPPADGTAALHKGSGGLSSRADSIEEDTSSSAALGCSKRLSRFLPSLILYQEYSDVAINREIQRQQGVEPGSEDEPLGNGEVGGATPPENLSPTSSFRSSRGSAFSLWQDIPDVRNSGTLDSFSNEERKLQEAKFELVTSEASYIRSLAIAVDHFMLSRDLSECLGAKERQWLFSKLPDVKDVSERFLQDLEQRLEEDILRFDVCDIVLAHCPALRRVYLPYVTNQAYQEQTYQRLLQENPRFPGILARLEEDPICQRLPLTSFLILPFQRITRLKMLVENILKRTTPGSRDEDTATKAFNELKKIIKECNSSVQSMKRTEELIHLNKKIHFEGKIFPLISQSRWLVKHGELLEVDTQTMSISGSKLKLPTRPVYLHLFNDRLLLSRKKEIGQLKVKDLSQKLQGISGFIFHLQLCDGPQLKHQILLKARTESEKQRWISAMFPPDLESSGEQVRENDDLSQVQCIKSYQAVEHDELTLEKADILQAQTITSDGWVEGIRLFDGERGWFPKSYVEEITSRSARLRNLRENNRIKSATQKLQQELL
ncbi:rho guanine nucleotide exchange factor 19-like isoform X2 [Conger conger]|uniref:rho guanine nucleotide exchange factor 19-like isoform X2 n=1 Tax=Conger conger TaxID=82655 RepID=UPI002A59DC32|nr:rho guanine nucleotide exchange factor 19-like isoform X2 [Conger conger]